jgi:hypothetical protein
MEGTSTTIAAAAAAATTSVEAREDPGEDDDDDDAEEQAVPVNASWVADLEDAKAALAVALRSGEGVEVLLESAFCRAYGRLRQWERLPVRCVKDGAAQVRDSSH